MKALQVDFNRGFRLWHEPELYKPGNDGYLPNKDDMVVSYTSGLFRVISVDYTAKTYVTVPWTIPKVSGVDGEDLILGAGPGKVSESFRLYMDDSVYPHVIEVDRRVRLWGEGVSNYKIFVGSDISPNGTVLTRKLDGNLEVADQFVGVHYIETNESGEPTVYRPDVAHAVDSLNTGDLVTFVSYNTHGSPDQIISLLVERTGFVRQTNQNTRYVTGLRLISPYLDNDTNVLRVPINMTVQSISLRAAIKYSDGNEVILPIDGTKVRLDGMDTYVATVVNQSVKMVLKYYLSSDEVNYSTLNGSSDHIARVYPMLSVNVDGVHTVKLLTYPSWNTQAGNWDLKHWLVNLDRNISRDVTRYVRQSATSETFNPSRYGVTQNLAFVLNLKEVSPIFNDYQHVQTVNINLISGPSPLTPWTVEFTPGQEPPFGWNLFAEMEYQEASIWKLRIDNGFTSIANWLSNLYRNQEPMFDPEREVRAPEPTHFRLHFKNGSIEYEMYQFNTDLIVPNDLLEGETLFIQFYQKIANTDLHLGVAGIPVKMV